MRRIRETDPREERNGTARKDRMPQARKTGCSYSPGESDVGTGGRVGRIGERPLLKKQAKRP